MALLRKSEGENPPPNYVKCTKEEAVEYQTKLIRNWTPASDVWAFRIGGPLLTASSALTGVLIADRFSKKFKLNAPGRIGLLFPAVITPVVVLPLIHHKLVTVNIYLQNECPLCLVARSAALQLGFSVVHPLLISPIASSVLAYAFVTTRVPDMTWKNVPAYYDICKKIILPKRKTILSLGILNVLLAMFIVDRQARSLFTVAKRLEEMESEKRIAPTKI